jgi:ribulose-phosphate 3-epimerase
MEIVPVLNCLDKDSAEKKLKILETFLDKKNFVHIDISDGTFANYKNFSDIEEWEKINIDFPFEVHLMVKNPEKLAILWSNFGANRIILHIETVSKETISDILKKIEINGSEIILAVNLATSIEILSEYIELSKNFLVLAVTPGPAGQEFDFSVLDKIEFLKKKNAIMIEVDGGINYETASEVKKVGANTIASGSFIFNATDCKEAFYKLKEI